MIDPQSSIGYFAQVACTWEVLARKAGNVCPGREYPDLTVNDFLVSAAAIAPVLDQAPDTPLGLTILRCLEATRAVVNTNTNLGIVLLLAPLASVPLGRPLSSGVLDVLDRTTVDDARHVYAAIRLAKPAGLGQVSSQDVHDEPTLPLRAVMALSAERDAIGQEYGNGFEYTLQFHAPYFAQAVERLQNIERAIIDFQIIRLFRNADSLIVRKAGMSAMREVGELARRVVANGFLDTPAGRQAYCELDVLLRSENHRRNPGTTADLIVAALFAALRDGAIDLKTPFAWDKHPFHDA